MKPASAAPRIGVDFDNTIIAYDEVFCLAAKRQGLLDDSFVGCKQQVRDAIRLLPDGELAWQRLQGQVYGKGITEARLMPGFAAFLRRCMLEGCSVSVVSHKTEFGHFDPDRVNLREAALDWMSAQALFTGDHGIRPENVFFEGTREDKLARISSLSPTYFIDDLEEVLTHPAFPAGVEPILFATGELSRIPACVLCETWQDVERHVFDEGFDRAR